MKQNKHVTLVSSNLSRKKANGDKARAAKACR